MAEENTPQGGVPPKQSPFKPIGGAAPAAGAPGASPPRTVVLRRPTLRKPGEGPRVTPGAPAAPAAASPISPIAPAPVPAAPAAPAEAPTMAAPAPAPAPVAKGIVLTHEEAAKKMTSRINIASATAQIPPITAQPAASGEGKTIKLRPPSPFGNAAVAAPAPAQPKGPGTTAPIAVQSAKGKTSRITLESAFSSQPEMAAPAQPKTIRLKRPVEAAAPQPKVAVKPPTQRIPPVDAAPAAPSPMKPISPLQPLPPQEPAAETPADEQQSPTRRKTIKVRRPGSSGGPKIMLNKGAEGSEEAEGQPENLQGLSATDAFAGQAAKPDKVNPVFLVAAILAIIVSLDLIWVLASQVFGPNAASADFAELKGPNVAPPPGVTFTAE